MNKLEQLCENLGVKINKPFQVKENGNWYKINDKGQILWDAGTNQKSWFVDMVILSHILIGILEVEWIPKVGETYWFPTFHVIEGVDSFEWYDSCDDYNIRKIVGIYKSKEEALKKSKELGWID